MRAASLLLVLAALAGAQSPDWQKLRPEILDRYRSLIRIDTTAGHETEAVAYLKSVLESEGIPTQTFALDPRRANLIARIKGNGSKRPLLILAHTDVVPVQREKWPVDPFGAVVKDGYIWGRGSKDDKPVLTANLIAMLLLKRLNVPLDRDVIFLAESGEESDTSVGISFMADRHFDEIDAEFAMTEAESAITDGSRVTQWTIATAEKFPARVRLVSSGTAGHGSVPRLDNALIHLGAAVEKVGNWETPMRLNDTTRTYFEKLSGVSAPGDAARYKALLGASSRDAAQRWLRENDPQRYSMLRTSVVPTMLKAGTAGNVIPSEAEATIDVRALPGEDLDRFFADMAKVINDPAVKIERLPLGRPPSPPARLDTDMYRGMERAANRVFPGAAVIPYMMNGATDQAQLRNKGIQSYGIAPAATPDDILDYPMHGDVERLAESSLYPFVQYVWEVVNEVAGHK
jgi:acetylornithine deacetylase/succinyl-diaminopimelate desuccinylase-like protein